MSPQDQWLEENFFPDAVMRIRNYLQAQFRDQFKGYYDGDPNPVGHSILPCISVTETDMTFDTDATETDQNVHQILVKVMFNKKDDYGAIIADKDVDVTSRKLRLIVSGRDPNTSQYLPNTILGVLRPNFTLGSYAVGNSGKVAYGVMEREDADGVATAEAHIMLTVKELQVIPVRT